MSEECEDVLVSVTATEIQTATGRKFWLAERYEPDRVARVKHCKQFLNKPCRIIYDAAENYVISMWAIDHDAGTPAMARERVLPSGNQYTMD